MGRLKHGRARAKRLRSRHAPVHLPPRQDWEKPVIIFVTVCTKDRKPILARPRAHEIIVSAWSRADGWLVGRYVIMPDHVHLFCGPKGLDPPELMKWIQYWKSLVAKEWPWPWEKPVWQRDFWDRQLRSVESYEGKWQYVLENPVRQGLVSEAEMWPYAGELNVLPW